MMIKAESKHILHRYLIIYILDHDKILFVIALDTQIKTLIITFMIIASQNPNYHSQSLLDWPIDIYLLREKKTPDLRASSFNQEASL